MENIRIYEEDGYIHFIMRQEDLMRLRYSTEAKTPFADFMDRWLTLRHGRWIFRILST